MIQLTNNSLKTTLFFSLFLIALNAKGYDVEIKNYVHENFKRNKVVNDYAKVLSDSDSVALNNELLEVNNRSTIEYAICIVENLGGFDKKDLAINLGNYWGIGNRFERRGLLILISTEDKSVFVATTNAAQELISDDQVQELVDEHLIPKLKNANYKEAVLSSLEICERLSYEGQKEKHKDTFYLYWAGIVLMLPAMFLLKYIHENHVDLYGSDPYWSSGGSSGGGWSSSGGSGSSGGGFDGGGGGGDF
ncbi:TPM domain-containing protein [Flammeovirga aprica]|uniref:TPM domain-containing protein n=1 Tax=Flammeovirga aprica JL-4 TaxID=694437 RepID=A0A7X9XBC7_9BACT|nr:TPM domain-containing protein [Flammeovirga aprica]NME70513.1 TPM domain-containing protein [Flammeovirga aprica JL-4]